MPNTKKRIIATLTATILTVTLNASARVAEASSIQASSCSTLSVGEHSGLIIGPSGTDYTVISSAPD